MNPLTGEQKRMLTKDVLGKCWHDEEKSSPFQCKKCGTDNFRCKHRTFDTGNDLTDLKEALVKKGVWDKFVVYCLEVSPAKHPLSFTEHIVFITEWLFNKDRFPKLVAEFMEVKK